MNDKTQQILKFVRSTALWFLVFYGAIWAYQTYIAEPIDPTAEVSASLAPASGSFVQGEIVAWKWNNREGATVDGCAGGVKLLRQVGGALVDVLEGAPCEELAIGETGTISFPQLQEAYFQEPAQYTLVLQPEGGEELSAPPVEIKKSGFFRQLFRGIISKPLFNGLVWITNALPGKSFGWGIVILTLIVRLLLFIPNQKAIRSQRAMQKIQPKLKEIQKKYKDDQTQLAAKMMELYKQNNVSPLSGCWPVLLQMPILFGIYYIVQDGLSPHLSYLLYDAQAGANLAGASTQFLGLDLSIANLFPLPFLVAGAQWLALRLSFSRAKKKKAEAPAAQPSGMPDMSKMQDVMQWAMPIMIGVFTATFPAGVGVYWLTSTLFGVGQHALVARQMAVPVVTEKV